MIKSKASRTTRKGRQHAILSTVVDLSHGRKRKKQMSFGEGLQSWDRKNKCLLQRQVAWRWVQAGTKVCQIFKVLFDECFFVLALNPNLLEGNTTAYVNTRKMLFYSHYHAVTRRSALLWNWISLMYVGNFLAVFYYVTQRKPIVNFIVTHFTETKVSLLYWLGPTVLH